ncbi:MAG: ATP-binding cassette domain-containing protein [Phycisphaerae bacterium]
MNDTQQPAVQIEQVTVRFDGQAVLESLDLTVPAGRKVVLSGPSGSGKSTLLRCLLGLLVPQSGRIVIEGTELDDRTVWQVRRRIGYVAQEPVLGSGTAREVLHRPFSYRANQDQAENLQRVPELFDRFCLSGSLLDKPVEKLSGGQKQRVALVSGILLDRPVLLLDEPGSALDEDNRRAVGEYLARSDRTVLVAGHGGDWGEYVDQVVELGGVGHVG